MSFSRKREIIGIEETRNKMIELLYNEMKYVFGPLARGGDKELLNEVMESLTSKIDKLIEEGKIGLMGTIKITISIRTTRDFYELAYCRIDISDFLHDFYLLEVENPTIDDVKRKCCPYVVLRKRGGIFKDTFNPYGEIRGYISVNVSPSEPLGGKSFVEIVRNILGYYAARQSSRYVKEDALKMVFKYRRFKERLKRLIGEEAFLKNCEGYIAIIFRYTVEMKINNKIPAFLLLLAEKFNQKDTPWVRVLIITSKKAIYCIERYNRKLVEENPEHGQRLIVKEFRKLDKSGFSKLAGSLLFSFPDLWVSVDNEYLQDVLFLRWQPVIKTIFST